MNTKNHIEWKDVVGYEGHYMVSNTGLIKSIKFKKQRILIGNKNLDGYLYVGLSKNGKRKSFLIHRLVAIAFITPLNTDKNTVNHRDSNRQNNCVTNLEWCTQRENIQHGVNAGNYYQTKITKLTPKEHVRMKRMFERNYTLLEIAEIFEVSHNHVCRLKMKYKNAA